MQSNKWFTNPRKFIVINFTWNWLHSFSIKCFLKYKYAQLHILQICRLSKYFLLQTCFFPLNNFTRYLLLGWICELIFSSSSVTVLSRKNYKIYHYSRIFSFTTIFPTLEPSRPNNTYYENKVNIQFFIFLSFCKKKSLGEGIQKRLILKI